MTDNVILSLNLSHRCHFLSHTHSRVQRLSGEFYRFSVQRKEWGRQWRFRKARENKSGVYWCRIVGCAVESLTFLVKSEQQDCSASSSVRWTESPRGSLKVHFFKKYFTSCCPPLNHMCFAISSSSTRSNFAVEKKQNPSFPFSCYISSSVHRNTTTRETLLLQSCFVMCYLLPITCLIINQPYRANTALWGLVWICPKWLAETL